MSRAYDNWEKLVGAVLKREELRRLALCESFNSSISADFSFRFSLDSALEGVPTESRIPGKIFHQASHSSHHGVQPIKYEEIRKATKNFQRNMFLGRGEYGDFFKGWMDVHTLTASKPGSGTLVAVQKCYHEEGQPGYHELLDEIKSFSQLHHPNCVKLIGYSCGKENVILIHEFVARGRLDHHLFRRYESLSWQTRIKVAIGAARGLSFLHDKEIPVILREFRSSHILLDGEFNAKLSYFSLARDVPHADVTPGKIIVIATYGYAAPEYVKTGQLTTKSSVYGFGVVLLELLSGLRVLGTSRPAGKHNLVDWAKPNLGDKRKMLQIMDTRLKGQYSNDAAYAVAKLASQCLSTVPEERPRMAEIVVALQKLCNK